VIPKTAEEKIVQEILMDRNHPDHPDCAIVLADITNLERNLLVFSQLRDTGIPSVLLLTMQDLAEKRQVEVDVGKLSEAFSGIPVITMNTRNGHGLRHLRDVVVADKFLEGNGTLSAEYLRTLSEDILLEQADISERFNAIKTITDAAVTIKSQDSFKVNYRMDRWLLHPWLGYVVFFALLLLMFEGMFNFASYPMDWMDSIFGSLSAYLSDILPAGPLSDLLTNGIIPGIGGVLVFVPQLAILFSFLSILEESGYMARVVFLNDRMMRPFGLNGRSIVPLLSSVACAVPGIMSARSISSRKDRLITIFVAPLMSCSARIPVYTLLIALVIPDSRVWGIFDSRSLVMLALYLLGFFSALFVAAVAKYFLKSPEQSFLILELPDYRWPKVSAVGLAVYHKIISFSRDAGKIIILISVILWSLSSYGPAKGGVIPERTFDLHESYMGKLGSMIEPVIEPLGFDWKIGISLLTSFAAREVFVGSMATIYGVNNTEDVDVTLLERMRGEVFADTGRPVYTLASGLSLMVFYVYAMQCMATMAVVRKETGGWKWPVLQMVILGIMAYASSWLIFISMS
jgi:ferrous iron transport protein B